MTLIFKHGGGIPAVVQQVLLSLGWVEFDENVHDEDEWNLYWKGQR